MELIINIPDKAYEVLKNKAEVDNIAESIIANGTPLPKGHDRLVEARAVIKALFGKQTIEDVPTVVEADESKEEKMITTLEEAIKHAKEVAEDNRKKADEWYAGGCSFAQAEGNECLECAKEHEQLAEWLEQLKAIILLYDEYKEYGGAFHYQVGRALDGDYVLPTVGGGKE